VANIPHSPACELRHKEQAEHAYDTDLVNRVLGGLSNV
jgi:hypothetical protein